MESSCNHEWVDLDPSAVATEYCETVDPGLPWSDVSPWPDQPARNTVFGHGSGYEYAAITLGGGCPTSQLFDFVVTEPSLTTFEAIHSGWDPSNSRLDLADPSVLLIPCAPEQEAIDCCAGHASSPNAGSPQCWSSIGIAGFRSECCFDLTNPLRIQLTQVLQKASECFDGMGNQIQFDIECSEATTTEIEVPVYLVDFADQSVSSPTSQDTRSLIWKLWKDDPNGTINDFYSTFSGLNPPDTASFVGVSGVWVESAGVATATTAGLYQLTNYTGYINFECWFRVQDPTKTYGLFFCATSTSPMTGMLVSVHPATKEVKISQYVAGVQTVLLTTVHTIQPDVGDLLFVKVDKDHITVFSAPDPELPRDDRYPFAEFVWCGMSMGSINLWTATNNQAFSEFNIDDKLPAQVSLEVKFDKDGWHVAMDKAFWPSADGYPSGSYDTDPGCVNSCCHEVGEYIPNQDLTADMAGALDYTWQCGGPPDGSALSDIGPCGGFSCFTILPPYSNCTPTQGSCCGDGDVSVMQWSGSTVVVV
jgi:hypothetical protein